MLREIESRTEESINQPNPDKSFITHFYSDSSVSYYTYVVLCIRPPIRAVCPDHEVVVSQPRPGTAPYLGSVANCTSY